MYLKDILYIPHLGTRSRVLKGYPSIPHVGTISSVPKGSPLYPPVWVLQVHLACLGSSGLKASSMVPGSCVRTAGADGRTKAAGTPGLSAALPACALVCRCIYIHRHVLAYLLTCILAYLSTYIHAYFTDFTLYHITLHHTTLDYTTPHYITA